MGFSLLFETRFFLGVVESTAAIRMFVYTVIIVFFNDLGGSELEKTQIAQENCDFLTFRCSFILVCVNLSRPCLATRELRRYLSPYNSGLKMQFLMKT